MEFLRDCDEIIDVRSPPEYAEDCVPGAVNQPALSAAERAEVGALHKESPFEARRRGAGMVASNLSLYLKTHWAGRPASWRPLVYCWRGGARSGAVVEVLQRVGWKARQLPGGYKRYRREVMETIADLAPKMQWRVVGGCTGAGKTHVLSALCKSGAQTVDLEALGEHRGSAFGASGKQPSQRRFESRLCAALLSLDAGLPVFVEAESRKIGAIHLPQPLLSAMRNAPMFFLRAEAEARARRLVADYPAMREHAPFAAAVEAIGGYVGGRQKEEWLRQHAAGEWESLAASLLSFYDAGYQKSLAANYANIAAEVAVVPDSINSIQTAAKEIQNSACLENGGG